MNLRHAAVSVLLGLAACKGGPEIVYTPTNSWSVGPVPLAVVGEAIAAWNPSRKAEEPRPFLIAVHPLKRPEEPSRLKCDWAGEIPEWKYVAPDDDTKEVGGTWLERSTSLQPDGGGRELPPRYVAFRVDPNYRVLEQVVRFRKGGSPEDQGPSALDRWGPARTVHVAPVCSSEDRVAVLVEFRAAATDGQGWIFVFKLRGNKWELAAKKMRWIA